MQGKYDSDKQFWKAVKVLLRAEMCNIFPDPNSLPNKLQESTIHAQFTPILNPRNSFEIQAEPQCMQI